MSEKEREELRLAEERNFAQACQKRKALGMLDDGEKARLWEEIRSRHDEEASSAWLQLFKRDVPRYWHGLAPSLRRKLLEVPSVRRLLFGDGLPRERERPYKHARMLLTDVILFFGAELRQSGAGMASAEQAKWAATVVVLFYPTLARRMSEPDRIEHIRGAITSTATSAKKKPWKLIIATWNEIERGIERGGHARWRIDYAEYTKGAPNRT